MTYQLTIEPIGETIEIGDGQTILDAALRAGIYMPYQCGHGLCSTCKIDVLEGEIDCGEASPFALMDFERDEAKALACCATALSDLVIEADIDEDPDARRIPVEDYSSTVAEIVEFTPDIRGIYLDIENGEIDFQSGQYVNLQIPGLDASRPFSIANAPSDSGRVELHVRRVKDGAGTAFLHDKLAVGDRLRFSAPMGHFYIRRSADKPCLFVAGGSGLSSPKSMVFDLLESDFDKDIWLFHGARGRKDLYFGDTFAAMAKRHDNFHYVPALSAPDAGDRWEGETGFIHEALNRRFDGRFAGYSAYLCGPPAMVEASIRGLMKGRLFEKDIFTEKFVTQADGEAALARSPLFRKI